MICRLCGSEYLKFKYTVANCDVYSCKTCSFCQIINEPDISTLEEIYSPKYFTHSKYTDTTTLNIENEKRMKILKRVLEPGKCKILDFGCASGDFVLRAKKYFEMWGIDFSEYAIACAKKKNPDLSLRLFLVSLENAQLEKDYFDAIVLWDVLEHIWDFESVLIKLLLLLKPEGFLVISMPNINSALAKISGRYWPMMTPPEHLNFFNLKSSKYLFTYKLKMKFIEWSASGKKVNVGFILYKIKRKVNWLVPVWLIKLFQKKPFHKLSLYIPSADIQYLMVQK